MTDLPIHIYVFAAILGLLILDFFFRFIIPSFRVRGELSSIIRQLKNISSDSQNQINAAFQNTRIMKPLWAEYEDSLHKQIEMDPQTQQQKIQLRSTMPAEAFFKPEIIVDLTLRADFFRHLPGIFTGIGIIGTFFGLLSGLQTFQISENPIIVRNSLTYLLQGVSMAFIVSAAAITLAMSVTFIEKWILSQLYARVETLVQLLDNCFASGIGEEYLARLVKASEFSANQAVPMQNALISELRQIMAEQSEKQISAIHLLGSKISSSIDDSLKQPMASITDAVKNVSTEQGFAVHAMMQDLLANFNKNLRELLGDQISNINETQQKTLFSLQETMSRMEKMATNVESAGERSAYAMASQLAVAMSNAETKQQLMNEKMSAFVEQLTLAVSQTQESAQAKLQITLDDIANNMSGVIQSMSSHIQATAETGRQHQLTIANESRKVVGEFGEQVDLMANGIVRAVDEMKSAVNAMRHTTGTTASQLNSAAEVLYNASTAFAKTGQEMTETLNKTSDLIGEFGTVSRSITGISAELSQVLSDYQAARDTMTVFLDSLKTTVEQSRREAALNSDVLILIEKATEKLVNAQKETDSYLNQVTEVIENAHHAFTSGMIKAVDHANQDFQKTLSDSVSLLRIGIQELGITLEELGSIRQAISNRPGQNTNR